MPRQIPPGDYDLRAAVIDASEICPASVDLNNDGVLDAADIELHLQQFLACE